MTPPALRIDGVVVEPRAFYAAACDPRRSCTVEACAGSGKTWLLVSRILRALLDGARPHEILAITFTRAAAGEMRQRLGQWLAEYAGPRATHAQRVDALLERGLDRAAAEQAAPTLAQLHGRLLAEGRPVEIRTFHAWFSQLLRSAPLTLLDQLGLQSDMALMEDIDEHRAEVMRAFHAAVLRDRGLLADHAALTRSRGRSQLQRWFDLALEKRVEFELADEAGVLENSVEAAPAEVPPVGHPVDVVMRPVWRDRLQSLAGELSTGGKPARDAADALVDALAAVDGGSRFEAAWAALFTKAGGRRVLKTDAAAPVQDALEAVAGRAHQHDARDEHLRMVRLTRVLVAEYAAYKRERGLADMADLERCALALLRDSELAGWIQERLDVRIRHLLIDEFQDTSPLQWHALHAWLAGYAGAGGGASGQRPPAVFIVGDPKQSIYRFRRAEPRVFAAATRFVRDGLDGRHLACDHTRRNAPTIVAAINAVFGAAPADVFTDFRPHTTAVAEDRGSAVLALPRTPRGPRNTRNATAAEPFWRDSLTTPRCEPEEVLREREAAAVAAAIAETGATGTSAESAPAASTFVLCRKRQTLRLVATALEAEQVGHAAVEEVRLGDAPEAQDLVAVLDVLVSPGHRLSLARALRSPLFGASDADLLAIAAAATGTGDWWSALQALDAASPALARARRLLARWRDAAQRLPPHDLLDRIVHEGELRQRLVAALPPPQRALALDAVDGVLAQALLLDGGRYATPYGFVRALRRRPVKAPPPVRADAVRLLTVHGAKGLEADTVFIVDAESERPGTETATVLVDWPVEAERPTRFAFLYSESRCPPTLKALLAEEMRARAREELNGLYVAMTRARRRLVFSATEPFAPPPTPTWWRRVAAVVEPWSAVEARGDADADTDADAAADAAAATDADADADADAATYAAAAGPGRADSTGRPPPGAAADAVATLKVSPWHGRASVDAVVAETVVAGAVVAGVAAADATAADAGRPMSPTVRRGADVDAGTPAARLGRAVHRTLEWTVTADGIAGAEALDAAATGAATAFDVDPATVRRIATTIVAHPAGRRFFSGAGIRWSGNEVPIGADGEALRIDRLVLLDEAGGPAWWVLDYKLGLGPERLADYRNQLLRYRDAVRAAQPGEVVRCAFVAGDGEVIEID